MKEARPVQKMQKKSGQKMLEKNKGVTSGALIGGLAVNCQSPAPNKLPKFFTVCSKN